MSNPALYTVGWICAITTELVAATAFLDEKHDDPESLAQNDNNTYTLGRVGRHNVMVACAPDGEYGTSSAAAVARDMMHSFPNIRIGLMVGIAGGVPSSKHDIRLGDIVVSAPTNGRGGIFQYDFGKERQQQDFETTGFLNQPPTILRTAVGTLRAQYECDGHHIKQMIDDALTKKPRLKRKYCSPGDVHDKLYKSDCIHPRGDERKCAEICPCDDLKVILRAQRADHEDDPVIHYGLIASGNRVIRDALFRDAAAEQGVLAFEMEAAGLMNHFPCLVIRGICDYCDSHKNKDWQGYAAMTAAAYAKDLLRRIIPNKVEAEKPIREIIHDVHTHVKLVHSDVKQLLKHQLDAKKCDYEWLTPIEYYSRQQSLLNICQPGTGTWFLEKALFKDWQRATKRTLYCYGMPGAGKTILSSVIVNWLLQEYGKHKTTRVIYLYCSYDQQATQSLDDLLLSMIRQAAEAPAMMSNAAYQTLQEHKSKRTQPTSHQATELLSSMFALDEKVYVVIDALDELSKDFRQKLLFKLLEIQATADVNIFLTSRPILVVEHTLIPYTSLDSIEVTADDEEIEVYLDHRMSELSLTNIGTLRDDIKTSIVRSARGMFLLAKLYFGLLLDKSTKTQVRLVLKEIEQKALTASKADILTGAYTQTMKRINSQPANLRELAYKALSWVAFATEPMSELALRVAVASKFPALELNWDDIPDIDVLISACHGLLQVAETIKLVHETTQDYFENHRDVLQLFQDTDPHTYLGEICAATLSLRIWILRSWRGVRSSTCESDAGLKGDLSQLDNPFQDYCNRNFGKHANQACKRFRMGIPDFLRNGDSVEEILEATILRNRPASGDALHLTAYWGLVETSMALLKEGHNPNCRDGMSRTPLHLAARYGHRILALVLVQSGADVNVVDDDDKTPLIEASANGHDWVARLLIKRGADIECRDDMGRTALALAAYYGGFQVVELLLEAGADVDARDNEGNTPLFPAVAWDASHIVRILLDHGADVNASNRLGQTVLHRLYLASEELLLLLLSYNADVDAEDNNCATPLFSVMLMDFTSQSLASISYSDWRKAIHTIPVKRPSKTGHLLDHGADSSKVLLTAALTRHAASPLIEVLLGMGVDVNTKDKNGWSALHLGCWSDNKEAVELLVHGGAEINILSSQGITPLAVSLSRSHCDIARFLLGAGADPALAAGETKSPLLGVQEMGSDTVHAAIDAHERVPEELDDIEPFSEQRDPQVGPDNPGDIFSDDFLRLEQNDTDKHKEDDTDDHDW